MKDGTTRDSLRKLRSMQRETVVSLEALETRWTGTTDFPRTDTASHKLVPTLGTLSTAIAKISHRTSTGHLCSCFFFWERGRRLIKYLMQLHFLEPVDCMFSQLNGCSSDPGGIIIFFDLQFSPLCEIRSKAADVQIT